MRKCIVLNSMDLTRSKASVLNAFFSEYLRVLATHCLQLPLAISSVDLHHLTYSNIRKTSFLPSDIVQEARKDVWKNKKQIEYKGYNGSLEFKQCSIRLNKRWFRFVQTKRGKPCFKITYSPKKDFVIPIKTDGQLQRFDRFIKHDWIFDNISILQDGRISVVLEKEFVKPETGKRYVVGIDVGSSTLAAVTVFDAQTSKVARQLYFGRDVAIRQRKYSVRRAYLESLADKGSHRANQHLERLKRKQFDFVKTISGQITKEIVNLAKTYKAGIAIEKLKNIRGKRGKFNRNANRKISTIPYGKFKEFLKSNSEMFEIPIHEVDAYHTSKWCPHCGAVNDGHQTGNYSLYKCKCGLVVNSDRKASLAIAVKSVLERTKVCDAKPVLQGKQRKPMVSVHRKLLFPMTAAVFLWENLHRAQETDVSCDKTHGLTNLSSIQISKTRVPVNGLLRSDDIGLNVAVQHNNQPMESPRLKSWVVYR